MNDLSDLEKAGRCIGLSSGRSSGRSSFVIWAKRKQEPPSEWDPDLLAFWARTSGEMSDDWKVAYNQLVIDLKQANIWNKLDVFYMFASHNEADARLNLIKNAHNATANNSPIFTAKQGFKTGGGMGYLDSCFNVVTDGVKYKVSDASAGIHINDTADANVTQVPFGVYALSASTPYFALYNGGFLGGINIGGYNITPLPSVPQGILALTRNNSSTYYLHSNDYFSEITDSSEFPSATYNIYILAQNNNGVPGLYFSKEISIFWAGSYLTQTQIEQLKIIDQNFKTRILSL